MPPTLSVTPALPFSAYLRDIHDTPLLSARDEKEVAALIRQGDAEARDHLVRANLRLVVNVARSYLGKGLCLEDLVSEGNLGLLRAAEGFDPGMQTRFSTYAIYWIRQSMTRALINTARTIRVPAYMAELVVKWRRAESRLQEELGRSPTEEEVGQALGLSAKKLHMIRKALRIYNGSAPDAFTEGPWSVEDAADHRPGPSASIGGAEEMSHVFHLIDRLSEREAAVLRMRYGLNGEEPQTLQEIGERLGLTRERVRQIEGEGLRKLREGLEAA